VEPEGSEGSFGQAGGEPAAASVELGRAVRSELSEAACALERLRCPRELRRLLSAAASGPLQRPHSGELGLVGLLLRRGRASAVARPRAPRVRLLLPFHASAHLRQIALLPALRHPALPRARGG
jgi:hypothetical protein